MFTALALFTVHKQETVYNRLLQSYAVLRYRTSTKGLSIKKSGFFFLNPLQNIQKKEISQKIFTKSVSRLKFRVLLLAL
jgi:hypothetical protein